MKILPKKIIRMNDGAEFLLNEVTQEYSLWYPGNENHLNLGYSYELLMESPANNNGSFKVADGKEDLMAMRKKWMDEMNKLASKNRIGCGED